MGTILEYIEREEALLSILLVVLLFAAFFFYLYRRERKWRLQAENVVWEKMGFQECFCDTNEECFVSLQAKDLKVLYVSENFWRMTGISHDTFRNDIESIVQLVTPQEKRRILGLLKAWAQDDEPVICIDTTYHKSGEDALRHGKLQVWCTDAGLIYLCSLRDDTREAARYVQLEEKLARAYVEGYHLSRTEAQAMIEAGETTASLTTQNAYAWAEVYVSGMGWLPVEVVPGMYVETYSSETIEGKPLFRVNASAVEDSSAEEGGSRSEEGTAGTAPGASYSLGGSIKRLFTVLLLLLYILFFLGLLLELERFLRLLLREKKAKARLKKGQKPEDDLPDYVGRLQWYMAHRGMNVKNGELKNTYEQFLVAFPDVEEAELNRAVTLLEKARFGRKNLKDYEKTTLEAFCQKVKESYYQESSFFKRMGARYLWLR